MTETELRLLENEFNILLPSDYKNQLLKCDLEYETQEFSSEYEHLRKTNKKFRDNGYFDYVWPDSYWYVGRLEDDLFIINTEDHETRVYSVTHGHLPTIDKLSEFHYETLDGFMTFLIKLEHEY